MSRLRRRNARLELRLGSHESLTLRALAAEVAALLAADGADDDPARARLLPDGYRDDPEAADEFARWTRADLADGKTRIARDIAETLAPGDRAHPVTVALDRDRAERWMRGLTDLRLTLAERLGIRDDGDAPPLSRDGAVYWWLGGLQESLVVALDRWDAEDADGTRAR